MSFPYVVSPSKTMNNPETNSLFADVAATGLRQALLRHKEPIVSSGFCPGPPWCHGHEAARWWAESDGYLYRNISFSPPASVHIKSLAHHTSILSPWPNRTSLHTSKPTCGGTFFPCIVHCFTASQIQRNQIVLSPFRHSPACELRSGWDFDDVKLNWEESAV